MRPCLGCTLKAAHATGRELLVETNVKFAFARELVGLSIR